MRSNFPLLIRGIGRHLLEKTYSRNIIMYTDVIYCKSSIKTLGGRFNFRPYEFLEGLVGGQVEKVLHGEV